MSSIMVAKVFYCDRKLLAAGPGENSAVAVRWRWCSFQPGLTGGWPGQCCRHAAGSGVGWFERKGDIREKPSYTLGHPTPLHRTRNFWGGVGGG